MDLEKDVLFTRHLKSLFIKRAAYFKRDKKAWMCTTILPSLFVLIGFLITIVKAPTRNLPSLTLNLSALNPNIAVSPVNPIPFNSPDNPYSCQPGLCTYQTPIVYVSETTEVYAFCGTQANLGVSVDAASFQVNVSLVDNLCTIDESTNILRTLDGFQGAAPVVADVETVLNVR